jgi:hypothetical protein
LIPPAALSVPDFIALPGFAGKQVGHGVVIALRSGHFHLSDFESLSENKHYLFIRGQVADGKIQHDKPPRLVENRNSARQNWLRRNDELVLDFGLVRRR